MTLFKKIIDIISLIFLIVIGILGLYIFYIIIGVNNAINSGISILVIVGLVWYWTNRENKKEKEKIN